MGIPEPWDVCCRNRNARLATVVHRLWVLDLDRSVAADIWAIMVPPRQISR
jgi:hypothetical protein